MPASDFYHDQVVRALEADGWTITADPLRIEYEGQKYFVDLAAERNLLAAEKGTQKIAVEIKSFLSRSHAYDLREAVGQFNIYRDILDENEPERVLFLAVDEQIYEHLFNEKYGRFIIRKQRLNLIVFNPVQERIIEWLKQ